MWKWPMQAWLHAMQARMSSSRPALALAGISGSAIIARVMPTMSAAPLARMRSASCGWLIRPATNTGVVTRALMAADSGTVFPGATIIGGAMLIALPIPAEVPEVML